MPINLSKGQKVDLTKKNPGLKKIMVATDNANKTRFITTAAVWEKT